MGKKKKKKRDEKAGSAGAAEAFSHNPFAALAGSKVAPTPSPPPGSDGGQGEAPSRAANPYRAKVVVRREKSGRGGKTVTRVSGLPDEILPDLALRMKRALGCGAVVEGADLVLLGSLVDRAAAWLEAEGAERIVRGN